MKSAEERFWSRVDKAGPDDCWNWTGSTAIKGYGHNAPININGKLERVAHRIAYSLVNGPIENNLHVLHACNNPKCCNVKHLRLGTNKENMHDRQVAGRTACGERMPRAKLTAEEVCVILTAYLAGYRICDLSRKYNMTDQGIQNIIYGKTWKHITGGINRRIRI